MWVRGGGKSRSSAGTGGARAGAVDSCSAETARSRADLTERTPASAPRSTTATIAARPWLIMPVDPIITRVSRHTSRDVRHDSRPPLSAKSYIEGERPPSRCDVGGRCGAWQESSETATHALSVGRTRRRMAPMRAKIGIRGTPCHQTILRPSALCGWRYRGIRRGKQIAHGCQTVGRIGQRPSGAPFRDSEAAGMAAAGGLWRTLAVAGGLRQTLNQ